MLLGILTLITALSISAVAIYYSVAGLVAIFAAAALPIMIMGGVLEISKLVTAVWLHRYWKQATWWLKSYLSVAVIVLMLITSMGIFGFLSKAHIEQTAQSTDNLARVETIQNEIDRNLGIVGRAENRIRQLETSGTGSDTNIQNQIDREQERIDKAFERIQPAIAEQNAIIAGVTKLFQDELDKIDAEIATLQGYIDNGETKKAQQMIGASADGIFGKNTAEKIGDWQDEKAIERAEWLTKIQDAANSPTVKAARDEIQRLRKSAEDQVANSQALIERLRTQLANEDNAEEIQKSIDEQNERVRTASSEIDQLTEEKIQLESEYRKLEAEVGPIKYIAEFIYGETADNNMLEEAVRWVIITIIFVFDPLAVLLLIASQYTFEWRRKLKDDSGERLRLAEEEFKEYEQARAQRIVDNPGFSIDDPKEDADENNRRETRKEESQDAEALRDGQDEERLQGQTENNSVVAESEAGEVSDTTDTTTTDDDSGDVLSKNDIARSYAVDTELEQSEVQTDEQDTQVDSKKKTPLDSVTQDTLSVKEEISEESKTDLEQWNKWVEAAEAEVAKEQKNIPDTKNRVFYPEELEDAQQYIVKEKGKQVTKETKPETSEGESKTGYIQNAEQTNESIWNNIQKKKPE